VQFDFNKIVERGMPAVTGGISGLIIMFLSTGSIEQEIVYVKESLGLRIAYNEAKVEILEGKQILPQASIRLSAIDANITEIRRRLSLLELFKTQGARCTFNDCKRIETRLTKVAESQTACLTSLATMTYRLDHLEKLTMELHFNADIEE